MSAGMPYSYTTIRHRFTEVGRMPFEPGADICIVLPRHGFLSGIMLRPIDGDIEAAARRVERLTLVSDGSNRLLDVDGRWLLYTSLMDGAGRCMVVKWDADDELDTRPLMLLELIVHWSTFESSNALGGFDVLVREWS